VLQTRECLLRGCGGGAEGTVPEPRVGRLPAREHNGHPAHGWWVWYGSKWDQDMSMIKRIYGRDGQYSTCYLTRVKLTPKTRWGQLYFHFFHRGDNDRDFHDHPYDFWTFPLKTYYERVLDLKPYGYRIREGRSARNAVEAFRWHFRPAEYAHIQEGAARYRWTTCERYDGSTAWWGREAIFDGWTATFVWRKATRREWGFWTVAAAHIYGHFKLYEWTSWRKYLFS